MTDTPEKPPRKPHPTRWQKNCPSPNPSGRPPKKKSEGGLFSTVDRGLASFLAADRKVIGMTDDGHEITRGDSLDLHLFRGAANDPRLMKLYIERKTLAANSEREVREAALMAAMEYQNKYLEAALKADKAGVEFEMLPHPLDIEIRGLEVKLMGPVTELDRIIVRELVKQRDAIHDIIPILIASTHTKTEFRRGLWLKLRRRHYRLQAKIPPRLRKPFPAWSEAGTVPIGASTKAAE